MAFLWVVWAAAIVLLVKDFMNERTRARAMFKVLILGWGLSLIASYDHNIRNQKPIAVRPIPAVVMSR